MIKIVSSLIFIFCCLATKAQPLSAGTKDDQLKKEFTECGKIKARPASSLQSSMLWIGGETIDRDYAVYNNYKSYLGALGAKKIRLQSGWAKTEKIKGQYDFGWLDSIVNDALQQGVQPWLQTSYGNSLYKDAGGVGLGEGLISSEEGFAAWEKYVTALVNHFSDRVKEWEIWNEADVQLAGKPQGDYLKLFMRTAVTIRKAEPGAYIVALALANAGNINIVRDFLQKLKDQDQLNLVNAITIHGYPNNPDESLESLIKMKEMIKSYSSDIQLWQGETGCPSSFGSSGALSKHAWTELTQAKWNSRRALLHIAHQVPFSLFTICEYTYASTLQQGLNTKGILKVNDDLTIAYAKPAYYAYQHLTSIFDSSLEPVSYEKVSLKDSLECTIATFQNKKSGKVLKAVWLSGKIPSDTNIYQTVLLNLKSGDLGRAVYADLLSGKVYKIHKRNKTVNKDTIKIEVPVYDSPVLIGDESLFSIMK